MDTKKKKLYSLLAIVVGLPIALMGAASQSLAIGGLFGFILALGIDGFIDSIRVRTQKSICDN